MTLLARVGGEKLIGKMTALFAANAPARLDAVAEALATEDSVRGEAAAHSLKSSAGQLGAIRLQHLCENLERAFHDKDIPAANSLFAQCRTELSDALEWMTQRRSA